MNDTMKLLRAFIEASGFDIEVIVDKKVKVDTGSSIIPLTTNYKVTKKKVK